MRQELEKYECFRRGSQLIDDIFIAIEKVFRNYELEPLRSGDAENRKLKKLDLDERIYEIIDGDYEIQPDWCPAFAKVCVKILKYSKMIIKELLKRGSSEDEKLNNDVE